LKTARKNDLWFHVKDLPGSHVVLETGSKEVDEQSIYEAACVAAFYSKGKDSSNVAVDYTLVKHVKKPSGAK
ncbi:MAG TPA: hypothetical protein DHN33_06790, partial [Eubacteriaceae bacterium]|nr:hypothetical protein [Eubacteriaceae bacterium]